MKIVKFSVLFTTLLLSALSLSALAEAEPAGGALAALEAVEAEPVYQVEFLVLRPYQRNDLNHETWSEQKPETPYPLAMPAPSPLAEEHSAKGSASSGAPNTNYRTSDQPLTLTPTAKPQTQERDQSAPLVDETQPVTQLAGFAWATEEQWNLPFTIKRLQRGGEYEILLHKAWRQTATARDQLVPLNIALAFDEENQVISLTQQLNQAAYRGQATADYVSSETSFGTTLANQPVKEESIQPGLFGTFAFSKGRYLHLTMDMVLVEQQAKAVTATERYGFYTPSNDGEAFSFGVDHSAPSYNYYRLNETRRIKTETTHYFDHPAFSVLAFVSRIEEEPANNPEAVTE